MNKHELVLFFSFTFFSHLFGVCVAFNRLFKITLRLSKQKVWKNRHKNVCFVPVSFNSNLQEENEREIPAKNPNRNRAFDVFQKRIKSEHTKKRTAYSGAIINAKQIARRSHPIFMFITSQDRSANRIRLKVCTAHHLLCFAFASNERISYFLAIAIFVLHNILFVLFFFYSGKLAFCIRHVNW